MLHVVFHLSVRHEYDTLVALGSANMGKTDTGVACSTLNDGSTGFYAICIHPQPSVRHEVWYAHSPTLLLRIQNYTESSTIFNAASGVLEFSLPVYITSRLLRECLKINLNAVVVREAFNFLRIPYQWRVPHCAGETFNSDVAGGESSRLLDKHPSEHRARLKE